MIFLQALYMLLMAEKLGLPQQPALCAVLLSSERRHRVLKLRD